MDEEEIGRLVVGEKAVVELKSVEMLIDLHLVQVLSYLRLGGYKLGYLMNFNVERMKDGIRRVVNGIDDPSRPFAPFAVRI